MHLTFFNTLIRTQAFLSQELRHFEENKCCVVLNSNWFKLLDNFQHLRERERSPQSRLDETRRNKQTRHEELFKRKTHCRPRQKQSIQGTFSRAAINRLGAADWLSLLCFLRPLQTLADGSQDPSVNRRVGMLEPSYQKVMKVIKMWWCIPVPVCFMSLLSVHPNKILLKL